MLAQSQFYQAIKPYYKGLCISLALINIVLIGFDIYVVVYIPFILLKQIVFYSLITITIFFLLEKEYELFLSLFSFAILNNPIVPFHLPLMVFKTVEFLTILLFLYIIYFIFYSHRAKYIEKIAYNLDEYLKELDHTLSGLSYHQILIYIHKRYPTTSDVIGATLKWKTQSIPEVTFEVRPEDFVPQHKNRGQVRAIFVLQFQCVEAYLNFNFSESVRFGVKMLATKEHKPSYAARSLRYILVTKLHYVDL